MKVGDNIRISRLLIEVAETHKIVCCARGKGGNFRVDKKNGLLNTWIAWNSVAAICDTDSVRQWQLIFGMRTSDRSENWLHWGLLARGEAEVLTILLSLRYYNSNWRRSRKDRLLRKIQLAITGLPAATTNWRWTINITDWDRILMWKVLAYYILFFRRNYY